MKPEFLSANTNWPISGGWMMIPRSGIRYVLLTRAKGLTCRSSKHVQLVDLANPKDDDSTSVIDRETDICTEAAISTEKACRQASTTWVKYLLPWVNVLKTHPDSRPLAVLGNHPGDGVIKAFDGRTERARLSVTVAETVAVPTAVHVVRHQPGGGKTFTPHSSRMDKQKLLKALALANGILAQAAVKIELRSYDYADIESDLGKMIDCRSSDTSGFTMIVKKRVPSASANIFIVGLLRNNSGTHGVTHEHRDIIVDDSEDDFSFARTLAHEFGHVLGLGHLLPNPKDLKKTRTEGNVVHYKQPPLINLMAPGDYEGLKKDQISKMRERARRL